ncbi:aminopeptidase [Micromonospora sp. LOL_025]|uniref:aminopeptidase n=1 Tax=Micromonospora sp. LOL_025 TaxID=3345413 RepID=UPI003A85D439
MRLSIGLLVASVAAGLLSVAAALLAMPAASLQFGLAMLLALLGYALVGQGARRVRWAVAAGVGLLAVVAVRLLGYQGQAEEAGWLTYGQGVANASELARWRATVDRERITALGLLLGVLCLAAGVLALPSRGRRRGVATAVLALLVLAWFGLNSARDLGRYPLPDLLAAVWPALLAALVTVGALALSGRRADRHGLLPLGMFLLFLATARTCADLATAWSGWWAMAEPPDAAFLEPGMRVSTSTEGFPQVSSAMEAAIALAGVGLAVIGALRSSREADAS